VEYPHTILAMANLASTYRNLGKCTEAEKLEIQVLDASNSILGVEHLPEKLGIQVLDARNRILGVEHPHTILAMENLAATLRSLGKYTEAEELVI